MLKFRMVCGGVGYCTGELAKIGLGNKEEELESMRPLEGQTERKQISRPNNLS